MIITIVGEPTAKARPRVSFAGGYVRTYTPAKTINYENYVKIEYQTQSKIFFPKERKLRAEIVAYYGIPKSVSKKKSQAMEDGVIRPLKKPDLDNIAKIILDALNGIAFVDDSQICELYVTKFYSTKPRVVLELKEIN